MCAESLPLFTADAVRPLLAAESITVWGLLPLAACRITRSYLLAQAGLASAVLPDAAGKSGSVLMLALPYLAPDEARISSNLSRYAIPRDYHLACTQLFSRLLPALHTRFPGAVFAGFADHSPLDERHAAAAAGLGVIGDNQMLITERYSSYLFLCEIVTNLPTDATAQEIRGCMHCGACRRACPVSFDRDRCLSALSQKKGALTPDEESMLLCGGSVWGCDICQEACPLTKRAREAGTIGSPLPFFREGRLPHLTAAMVEAMDDDAFAERAYAWRGRQTILRNLRLFEQNVKTPEQHHESL